MTLLVFKCVYLLLIIIGLVVNVGELRSAMSVYQTLIAANINGSRQALASHFVRKAVMLCGIQTFLAVPAVISLFLSAPSIKSSPYAGGLTVFAILSHMGAVLMLMLMALMSWYDRNFSMNMLSTEANSAKKLDTIEKADVAVVLKALAAVIESRMQQASERLFGICFAIKSFLLTLFA